LRRYLARKKKGYKVIDMSQGYRPGNSQENHNNMAVTSHKTKAWHIKEDRNLDQKNGVRTFALVYMQLSIFGSLLSWLVSKSFMVFIIVASSSLITVAFFFIMVAVVERQNKMMNQLDHLVRISVSSTRRDD